MKAVLKFGFALAAVLAISCSDGGGIIVGSDEAPTDAENRGVTVGSSSQGITVGLARLDDASPTEPTDATIINTLLRLNVTSYGTLDGGVGNCEESTLAGYYFGNGEVLEMSSTQNASLPVIENAPENLCGLYMVLEPRASGVTSGAIPSVTVEILLSDGRTIHFEAHDPLFLVAPLGSLDPASVTFALDPLGWFSGLDLGSLDYDSDQLSQIARESQPDLYTAILANIALNLVSSENSSQEP